MLSTYLWFFHLYIKIQRGPAKTIKLGARKKSWPFLANRSQISHWVSRKENYKEMKQEMWFLRPGPGDVKKRMITEKCQISASRTTGCWKREMTGKGRQISASRIQDKRCSKMENDWKRSSDFCVQDKGVTIYKGILIKWKGLKNVVRCLHRG